MFSKGQIFWPKRSCDRGKVGRALLRSVWSKKLFGVIIAVTYVEGVIYGDQGSYVKNKFSTLSFLVRKLMPLDLSRTWMRATRHAK
jgi:hypothetical protein